MILAAIAATSVAVMNFATPVAAQVAGPANAANMRIAAHDTSPITSVRWRGRGHWRGGHHWRRGWGYRGDNWGPAVGAGIVGFALGSALSAQAQANEDDAVSYCMQRFKSYDPSSGTYLGYDGYRHPCP
jgi:hypothetical protein